MQQKLGIRLDVKELRIPTSWRTRFRGSRRELSFRRILSPIEAEGEFILSRVTRLPGRSPAWRDEDRSLACRAVASERRPVTPRASATESAPIHPSPQDCGGQVSADERLALCAIANARSPIANPVHPRSSLFRVDSNVSWFDPVFPPARRWRSQVNLCSARLPRSNAPTLPRFHALTLQRSIFWGNSGRP